MNEINYASGITAQNLRAFLQLWPLVAIGIEDSKKTINECSDQFFDKEDNDFSWCYLYELPTYDLVVFLFSTLCGVVPHDQILNWFKQMADTSGNIGA
ncbi:hypothetical protein [Nitrosomonas supralitoralis]|uniref:Uncharacterized protein n=1 Tax=Nitrosomonas supralitoralis TaxID=2116706 RepID=A0A2P7NXG3_9PROT|nr:hypothetical protein [Nitrosomonas supralitoralis]PSJ18147.1 hypothetical protein C7H79_04670 [Nitrosomonas supralitoralis]